MPPVFLLLTCISFLYNIPLFELEHVNKIAEDCFYGYSDSLATHQEADVKIESSGATLAGRLFIPETSGPHPAVILVHGGGNHVDRLRSTPHFFAPRLAQCGFAALVYDKRGTGDSGGDYSVSTFDDFIADAGAGAQLLAAHQSIDKSRIGVLGFSQGGRLAPVIAVRYPVVSFAISVSGPLTSVADTRLYALENNFKEAGVPDERMQQIMPLWHEHFRAITTQDNQALQALDNKLTSLSEKMHSSLLPPFSNALPRTGIYNSLGRDYTTALAQLSAPWFSLYGEDDIIVPVKESVAMLNERMKAGDHTDYEVKIVPSATHSFVHSSDGSFIRFEAMIVDWLLEKII
ncbi:MAG: alpha/beta hydrolase family protein [Rhodothermales bacterium]